VTKICDFGQITEIQNQIQIKPKVSKSNLFYSNQITTCDSMMI